MSRQPFLVIGAMKSGTTTLETLLRKHPDVAITVEKESTAFDGSARGSSAARSMLDSPAHAAGEVSTGYMQAPVVTSSPEQARQLLGPELKVIAVLRDPLDRACSHWRHWEQLGRNESNLLKSLTDSDALHVRFSQYYAQLERWTAILPTSQILVIRIEDYALNPPSWHREITDFLGLHPLPDGEMIIANDAGTRLATQGLARRISRSNTYRRFIRPLVPRAGRRGVARTLGASVGGGEPTEALDHDTVNSFRSLIADDAEKLMAVWPHATWPDH